MPSLTRPGVYVDESAFPTFVASSVGTAVAAFVAPHFRGPLAPTIVNSWSDFVASYGGFEVQFPPSPLALGVYSYFSAGGTSAVICRSVNISGSPPVTASNTLNDTGSPSKATLTINAINPGLWGNNLSIDILAGTLQVGGVIQTFTIVVKYMTQSQVNIVERFDNVSMDPAASFNGVASYAIDRINSPATGSQFITLTDHNSSTVMPQRNPAVTTSSLSLLGGSDGPGPSYPDNLAALHLLDQFPDQPFVLNMPGLWTQQDVGNALTYAQGRNDIFVVIDCPPGKSPSDMAAWTGGLASSGLGAIYYPQVLVNNPYLSQAGATTLIPPGGYVTGKYVSTDATRGVQKAPAGLGASLQGVYGLERVLSNSDLGLLTQANVNAIVNVPGSGIVIWGARTLSNYLFTRYVSVSRTLIYLQTQFVALTRFAVFEPNDYILWNLLNSVLSQFLTSFWQSGGLAGNSAGQAFYVLCDATNNTASSISNGIVNVEIGVSLERPAEFVVLKLGQWAGGQTIQIINT